MSLRNQIPTGPNPYTDGFSTSGTSNQGTPIVFQDPIPLNSGIPHLFDGNASSLPTAGTLDEPVLITIVGSSIKRLIFYSTIYI